MQSFHTPPRRRSEDDRILPLINVVFLLLIFFMIAGQLSATDPFEVEPPVSASAAEPGEEEIVIHVAADGQLALDGDEVQEAAMLSAVAERMQAARPGPLRLKADGDLPATELVALMERLREAGVENLTLLTVAESD